MNDKSLAYTDTRTEPGSGFYLPDSRSPLHPPSPLDIQCSQRLKSRRAIMITTKIHKIDAGPETRSHVSLVKFFG